MSQENVEAVRAMWEPFKGLDTTTIAWVKPLDYIKAGDCVVVSNRQRGVGKTSGAPVEIEVAHVYEFQDNPITRVDEHDTLEEALEAAGMSEQDARADSS